MTLLSISTDALTYDFVRARETGEGLTNTQISNSITSDLLRGMQLSFTHDLFGRGRYRSADSVGRRCRSRAASRRT
jgi:hypothetical protein